MSSEELAKKARLDVLEMIHNSHASHIGSAFSVIDILSVLYNDIINVNNENIDTIYCDKVVLSKGHAGSALYSILAELNYIDRDLLLKTYYQNGSIFSGHISHKNVRGIEVSTGSLGQGISMACGIALASKIKKIGNKTYCIIGDGECNEGSVWETIAFATQQKLYNFVIIVDCNKMQAMGNCNDIISIDKLSEKFKAFGCNVIDIEDGNNHDQLRAAFELASKSRLNVFIANTIKGKGVSFMENNLLWHYRDPQDEFYVNALKELNQ